MDQQSSVLLHKLVLWTHFSLYQNSIEVYYRAAAMYQLVVMFFFSTKAYNTLSEMSVLEMNVTLLQLLVVKE